MSNKQQDNPYAAYARQTAQLATDPREIEANALLNANRKMMALQARWAEVKAEELEEVLRFNRQIWMIFVDTAVQNANAGHSVQLRSNIANLGMFIFKHSLDISVKPTPEKLDTLININRQIIAGLTTKPKTDEKAAQPPTGGGIGTIKA